MWGTVTGHKTRSLTYLCVHLFFFQSSEAWILTIVVYLCRNSLVRYVDFALCRVDFVYVFAQRFFLQSLVSFAFGRVERYVPFNARKTNSFFIPTYRLHKHWMWMLFYYYRGVSQISGSVLHVWGIREYLRLEAGLLLEGVDDVWLVVQADWGVVQVVDDLGHNPYYYTSINNQYNCYKHTENY